MKFEVPLMMPAISTTRSAASASRRALTMGMQPAMAASKRIGTRAFCARAKMSSPFSASSALLAVTTGLPRSRARKTAARAVFLAADEFDDGVRFRILDGLPPAVGERRKIRRAFFGAVFDGDRERANLASGALFNQRAILREKSQGRRRRPSPRRARRCAKARGFWETAACSPYY